MHVRGAGHCDGIGIILESISGFILDGGEGCLLLHIRFKPSPLDHEVINHPVEYSSIVVSTIHIIEEVLGGDWRFLGIELERNISVIGF